MNDDKEMDYKAAQRELQSAIAQIKELETITEGNQKKRKSIPPYCSFCGRGKNEVTHMIKGITAYICDECVEESGSLMKRLKDTDE